MESTRKNAPDPIGISPEVGAADRRSFARYSLRGTWRVHDRVRGRPVGTVCDIGLGGLRLEAPEPIPPARRYALSIEIDVGGAEHPRVEVIARCAWHRARPDLHFEAGFEFVEMTPQMRNRIAQYIDQFAQ